MSLARGGLRLALIESDITADTVEEFNCAIGFRVIDCFDTGALICVEVKPFANGSSSSSSNNDFLTPDFVLVDGGSSGGDNGSGTGVNGAGQRP